MPNLNPPRSAEKEYLSGPRIPTALPWNPDIIATTGEVVRGLPHMLPTAETFADEASKRGITGPETHVVCYDTTGLFSSPRTAFTFAAFGHERISVLDGGLPRWQSEGFALDSNVLQKNPQKADASDRYPTPKVQSGWVRTFDEMIANIRSPQNQIVLDARARGRFDGTQPEPRNGLSSGHIPKSLSLPFNELLESRTSEDGTKYNVLKDQVALYRTLREAVTDGEGQVCELDFEKLRQASSAGEPALTASCGSGMTAAVIWLAMKTLGVQASVYDESWMGYASRETEGASIAKTKSPIS